MFQYKFLLLSFFETTEEYIADLIGLVSVHFVYKQLYFVINLHVGFSDIETTNP